MAVAKLDYNMKVNPIIGEDVSADLCVVKRFGKQWLVAVIDGLGHGEDALEASLVAEKIIKKSEQTHLATILSDCHEAMKKTRGAVIGLALIDYAENRLTWVGAGNIEGKVVWRNEKNRIEQSTLMSMPGVVGYNLPRVHQQVYDLKPGTLIIAFTDGLTSRWIFPEGRWLFEMETEKLAVRLMKSYSKKTDDSLVAVVRY